MTPEQIAEQQLWAAWVAAGAAVAQAVGAVAAIWFSVKLAREAERRAGKAERDALAREAAAAARMDQAEKEREERRRREELARHNQAVETVTAQGDEALEVLRKWLSHYEGLAAEGHMGITSTRSTTPRHADSCRRSYPSWSILPSPRPRTV